MNGSEKVIDALVQLLEGYQEMREAVEEELNDSDEGTASESEINASLGNEIKSAIESLIENEGYTAEELAPAIIQVTAALEELEPDAFENKKSDDDEEDEDDEELDDEEDEDDDEDDEDEDDEDYDDEDED